MEKKTFDFVCNLLAEGSFTEEKIAPLAAVNVDYVKKVKATLEKNPTSKPVAKAASVKSSKASRPRAAGKNDSKKKK